MNVIVMIESGVKTLDKILVHSMDTAKRVLQPVKSTSFCLPYFRLESYDTPPAVKLIITIIC